LEQRAGELREQEPGKRKQQTQAAPPSMMVESALLHLSDPLGPARLLPLRLASSDALGPTLCASPFEVHLHSPVHVAVPRRRAVHISLSLYKRPANASARFPPLHVSRMYALDWYWPTYMPRNRRASDLLGSLSTCFLTRHTSPNSSKVPRQGRPTTTRTSSCCGAGAAGSVRQPRGMTKDPRTDIIHRIVRAEHSLAPGQQATSQTINRDVVPFGCGRWPCRELLS